MIGRWTSLTRRGAAVLALVLPPVLLAATCSGKKGPGQAAVEPTVFLVTPGGSEVRVKVEIARTASERQRGLMYRESLEKGTGMIFVFDDPGVQVFWMKNTMIPLDMIFIGEDLAVVGVVESAEPLTLTPRTVGVPSLYVLEVEGGFAALHGIVAGTKVRFVGLDVPGVD